MFDTNETLEQARTRNIQDALREDIGVCDWTAQLVPSKIGRSQLSVRQKAVLCGKSWFEGTIQSLDPKAVLTWFYQEGDWMVADTPVCEITADVRALLSAERTAINFLQTLSATATNTKKYVEAIVGLSPNPNSCVVLDLAELDEAIKAGAKNILIDNFSIEKMHKAVAINQGRAQLEASGGIGIELMRAIAASGVDRISLGKLTKDVQAVDFSMRMLT